jgi:molybdopterin-guanine dinucleotide biosynthesis protein
VATRFLQIVGWSGTGKTRLVTALGQRLPVAVYLKWTHHALPDERKQSDTGRMGSLARLTALVAPEGGIVRGPLNWRHWYLAAAAWAPPNGLCLVEGGKRLPVAKVAVGEAADVGDWPGVRAVIGPSAPPEGVAWCAASLPLDPQAAEVAAQWIVEHLEVVSFTLEALTGLA